MRYERTGLEIVLYHWQGRPAHRTLHGNLIQLGYTPKEVTELKKLAREDLAIQVRRKFIEYAKQHHPDIGGDLEMFKTKSASYSRLEKKLIPNHIPKSEQGYVDAMVYANVRF